MKPRYQASRAAIELIKRFEGFRSKAACLPDGNWTIGYGHSRTAREGVVITESDADALLIYDVSAVVAAISEWVFSPLTQNQFDSLVAFAFNIGLPNFRRSSVLRRLNEGATLQAACAMEMWRTADFEGERIVIDALVRRRSAEMALFLTSQDGYIPVPSLIVMPRVDEAVARAAPGRAAEVEAPLEGDWTAMLRIDEPEPPSASRAAADAITARLNAILQDNDPAPDSSLEIGEPLRATGAPLPPEDDEPVVGAAAEDEPIEEPLTNLDGPFLAGHGPVIHPALNLKPIAFSMGPVGPASRRKRLRRHPPSPLVAAVGLAGLGAATAGMFWGFSANAGERLPDPVATGWGLSLVGASLMASSVYVLLKRLGSRGE